MTQIIALEGKVRRIEPIFIKTDGVMFRLATGLYNPPFNRDTTEVYALFTGEARQGSTDAYRRQP